MSQKDLELLCRFHNTSKASTWDEEKEFNSYGFRGCTIANLSCLSQIKVTSRKREEMKSLKGIYNLTTLVSPLDSCTGPAGTKISVKGLLNQFSDEILDIKTNKEIQTEIDRLINMFSIIHHKISFKVHDSRSIDRVLIRSNSILEAFKRIFPGVRELKVITYHFKSDNYSGYFVLSRPNSVISETTLYTAINGRYFENNKLKEIVTACYKEAEQTSKPVCIILLRHKMPIYKCTIDFSPPDQILDEIKTFLKENLESDVGWLESPTICFDGFAVCQGTPQFDIPFDDVQRLLVPPIKAPHSDLPTSRGPLPGPIVRRIVTRQPAVPPQPPPIQVRHVGGYVPVPVPVQVHVPVHVQVPVPVQVPRAAAVARNQAGPLETSPPRVNFAVEPAIIAGRQQPPATQPQVQRPSPPPPPPAVQRLAQPAVAVQRVVQRTVIAPPPAAVSHTQPQAVVVKTIPKKPVVKRIVANPIQQK